MIRRGCLHRRALCRMYNRWTTSATAATAGYGGFGCWRSAQQLRRTSMRSFRSFFSFSSSRSNNANHHHMQKQGVHAFLPEAAPLGFAFGGGGSSSNWLQYIPLLFFCAVSLSDERYRQWIVHSVFRSLHDPVAVAMLTACIVRMVSSGGMIGNWWTSVHVFRSYPLSLLRFHFQHSGLGHLTCNMLALLSLSSNLPSRDLDERAVRCGALLLLTSACLVPLAVISTSIYARSSHVCYVGLSGYLFSVLTVMYWSEAERLRMSPQVAAWKVGSALVITQLIFLNQVSFVGHAAGVCAGCIYSAAESRLRPKPMQKLWGRPVNISWR